jgi:protein SCO1/2
MKTPPPESFRGLLVTPVAAAPSFSLGDQTGHRVSMTAERGHYVVVTFLYTHCPDVCPVIAGTLNRVLRTPQAQHAGLRVLAVSVDPKGDTRAAVDRFVRVHQLVAAFHYLTGTSTELRPVWNGFHVASISGPNAVVSHSAIEYLIDPQGQERLIYDSTVTAAEVVHDLTLLEAHR